MSELGGVVFSPFPAFGGEHRGHHGQSRELFARQFGSWRIACHCSSGSCVARNFLASTGIGLACIMSLLAIFLSLVVAMRTYRETVYGLLAVKTLVAEQLHVRGKSGSEAAICVDASGEPTLCFYDRTGTSRIYLGLASDGHPHIVLRDQEGRLRTQVTVPANGQSSYGRINFFGPGEKNLIEFGIDPGGQPELRFNSEDDQCRIIVDISPDRSGPSSSSQPGPVRRRTTPSQRWSRLRDNGHHRRSSA